MINYRVDMYLGDRRLMIVSFHRTRLEASLKVAEYALEDKENGKTCYNYRVVEL